MYMTSCTKSDNQESVWHTSSLYTFSPLTGLIISHEVETVRPLPGEGVAEWLMTRLLGWTQRQGVNEGAIPCPRTVPVEVDRRFERVRSLEGSLREMRGVERSHN